MGEGREGICMRGISGNGRGKRGHLYEGKYQGMGEGREGICMRGISGNGRGKRGCLHEGNIREWEREERAFA